MTFLSKTTTQYVYEIVTLCFSVFALKMSFIYQNGKNVQFLVVKKDDKNNEY